MDPLGPRIRFRIPSVIIQQLRGLFRRQLVALVDIHLDRLLSIDRGSEPVGIFILDLKIGLRLIRSEGFTLLDLPKMVSLFHPLVLVCLALHHSSDGAPLYNVMSQF